MIGCNRFGTDWQELDAERATVTGASGFHTGADGTQFARAIRVKHPDMPRVRYFNESRNGNWYWRATDAQAQRAAGYIIKGDMRGRIADYLAKLSAAQWY